jgi:hypothetical protein
VCVCVEQGVEVAGVDYAKRGGRWRLEWMGDDGWERSKDKQETNTKHHHPNHTGFAGIR